MNLLPHDLYWRPWGLESRWDVINVFELELIHRGIQFQSSAILATYSHSLLLPSPNTFWPPVVPVQTKQKKLVSSSKVTIRHYCYVMLQKKRHYCYVILLANWISSKFYVVDVRPNSKKSHMAVNQNLKLTRPNILNFLIRRPKM